MNTDLSRNELDTTVRPDDILWDEAQTARFTRMEPETLTAWRFQRKGPPFLKLGSRVGTRPTRLTLAWTRSPHPRAIGVGYPQIRARTRVASRSLVACRSL